MRKGILIIILFSVILGCKKSKKGDAPEPNPPVPEIPAPAKALLTAPAQNEACITGTDISASQSSVTFTWSAAANAESYDVVIKNLLTNTSSTHAATQTTLQIPLLKGTPYSWYVKAKTTKTTSTSQSDIWKFYNSGNAQTSYAPFPAEAINPAFGTNVLAGKVTLKWTGSDVDDDIVSYAIYLGITSTPALLNGNVAVKELPDVTVSANTTYYWKVVTKDSAGNTSDSGVFQFKVD